MSALKNLSSRQNSGSCGLLCEPSHNTFYCLIADEVARFAFQPWHSAVEFRRYLHRFIYEFPRINTLAGVHRTPYNQHDSIILPIETYLKDQGVEFRYGLSTSCVSVKMLTE
jgi:myosin-crossreactive antigen